MVERIPRLSLMLAVLCVAACSDVEELRHGQRPVSLDDVRRVPDGNAQRGRTLVPRFGCVNCHEIPGHRNPTARVGPSLDRFALRANIGGTLPNQPDRLVDFLINSPQELPGTGMPALRLAEADARDIAAYLYSLR